MNSSDEEEEEAAVSSEHFPEFHVGQKLSGAAFAITEGKTKPPAPFNEATLLSAMGKSGGVSGKHDKAMAKTLGETGTGYCCHQGGHH